MTCSLVVVDRDQISASFETTSIEVSLPRAVALRWAGGNDVSLHGEQSLAHGTLRILVEKDFTCVEPREGEDQTDLYPNPKASSVSST